MEAAATPFPREETTPPVTNTYLGAVRKSLEILRVGLGTDHYDEKISMCQIPNRRPRNFFGSVFSETSIEPTRGATEFQFFSRSRRIFSTRSMSAGTSTLTGSYSVSTTRM